MEDQKTNYIINISGGPEPLRPSVARLTYDWIRAQIDRLADSTPGTESLYKTAKHLNLFPLSTLDDNRWYGIRPDGDLVSFEINLPYHERIEENLWTRAAILFRASEDWPELRPLIPPQPLNSRPCPRCQGTGKIQLGANWHHCVCGGTGWLPPVFDEMTEKKDKLRIDR